MRSLSLVRDTLGFDVSASYCENARRYWATLFWHYRLVTAWYSQAFSRNGHLLSCNGHLLNFWENTNVKLIAEKNDWNIISNCAIVFNLKASLLKPSEIIVMCCLENVKDLMKVVMGRSTTTDQHGLVNTS